MLATATETMTSQVDFRPLCEVAVMVAEPKPTAVTLPPFLSTATDSSLVSQIKSVAEW